MKSLNEKLIQRGAENRLRSLKLQSNLIDFCSNDYLGFSRSIELREQINAHILNSKDKLGSTGSRLVSGNSIQFEQLERYLAHYHDSEAALIFNSGYDANLALFSSVADRGDTILYDELSHASIRDGVRLSFAKSYSFKHNDLSDLAEKASRAKGNLFIAVESIYSMDGDAAPLCEISDIADRYCASLIIDEAHSTGVYGSKGQGLVFELGLQRKVFARLHTFGKAIGAHGAVVVGSKLLRDYLINFARPFIYSTALPPHSLIAIEKAYKFLEDDSLERNKLLENIKFFTEQAVNIEGMRTHSSAIQVQIVAGNQNVKEKSSFLASKGFDVRPILSPTVAKGSERLRICLHSYNSKQEIAELLEALKA